LLQPEGSEAETGLGDHAVTPPGRDARTVGDEPRVLVNFVGKEDHAEAEPGARESYEDQPGMHRREGATPLAREPPGNHGDEPGGVARRVADRRDLVLEVRGDVGRR